MDLIFQQGTGNLKPMEINHITIRQYCNVSKSLKAAWKCEGIDFPHGNIRNSMDAFAFEFTQSCTFLESVLPVGI